MLDEIYFFSELSDIKQKLQTSTEKKQIVKDLKSLFYEFIYFFLRAKNQYFPSNYSRIIFIINNYHLKEEIKRKLLVAYSFFSKARKNSLESINLVEIVFILADIFAYFLNRPKPKDLYPPDDFSFNLFQTFFRNYPDAEQLIDFRKVIVENTNPDENSITCLDDVQKISIDCTHKWQEIPKVVAQGTILNCFGLIKIGDFRFATTENSLIVVEPDYLYDITDISQCFTNKGSNAYLYFLNKFFPKQTSYYTFLGNIINQILDILLIEKGIEFEELIQKAISKKILPFIVLKQKDPYFIKSLYADAKLQYLTLSGVADVLTKYPFQIEPTFFSADYGIIGRMDILLESNSDTKWKTIVELKSGNPPSNHINISFPNRKKISIAMWSSHYAQTIGYNLLVDSAVPNRKGSSMILYSRDNSKPLREAINTIDLQREFIKVRNWIFLLEMQLAKGKFSVLETLNKYLRTDSSGFYQNKNFVELLVNAKPEVRALIEEYIKFIINENIISKIGDINNETRSSQSSLWNVSLEYKDELENTLASLRLNLDRCDFENDYLYFEITDDNSGICSLRKGDPVVIYHPDYIQNPYSFQLFKGAIKQIEPEYVIVTLRNKFSDSSKFHIQDGWVIEQDYIESTTRNLYQSLFNFLLIEPEKIDFLLGNKPVVQKSNNNLNHNFKMYSEVITKAIVSYPYFLIIGPPGTGKTRIVVKELLKFYISETKLKILVCTYTNRAVDEIVDVLNNENYQDYYIRIGNKEASEHASNMLAYLAEKLSPNELEQRIANTRIFLGTAYSFLTNPEIFELSKFDIAIIDEASQLLFPHIAGIISQVDKFILIGDDKQLPAVILQDKLQAKSRNKSLKALGYEELSMSYFEFLLRKNKEKNWNHSIGVLDQQSRMHPEVLAPINSFFYQGVIKTNPNRLENRKTEELISYIKRELNQTNNSRVVLLDIACEKGKKLNIGQAKIIANLINGCYSNFKDLVCNETFGVISPFRIQNAAIISFLHPDLRKIVTIDTIERFQGSEREIIFLSLPFNRQIEIELSTNISKMEDGKKIDRKLNVALTRAKEFLVVLGNLELLSKSAYYKDFLFTFFDKDNILKLPNL